MSHIVVSCVFQIVIKNMIILILWIRAAKHLYFDEYDRSSLKPFCMRMWLDNLDFYDRAQWRRQLWGTGARAPSTSNNFILVHFGVNLWANYPRIV